MKTIAKLSSEERRAAIIKAVRRVFAEKGFDGTTTRELADAAGVSEALLFKHFPTKEALFSAMKKACCSEQDAGLFERLTALEPSASTLVLLVHFLVSRIVTGCAARDEDQTISTRLMLRSLVSDGDFARTGLANLASAWIPKVEECIEAAGAGGEAVDGPAPPALRAWFTHHLAAMLMACLLPETPVVDYGVPRDKLVEQAVWFSLRGMGLKDDAIRRYYNPKALALFTR
ncbi:MAG TPA: helix-turn-helix domain-containing protein [Gemmataceae bacterium]|nr:helix-turn-helix domain-containing protein [Gemmataceae bacterium]